MATLGGGHGILRLTALRDAKYDIRHMKTVKAAAGSKKEQTRERILRAAARAIRKHGYEGVGVADVMKEAGLTHGGFYAHFDSRDTLLPRRWTRRARSRPRT